SLSCDFRLATADVNYGDPRIHRAMWAAEGWSYKLVRQLDQSAVTPIAYEGERMDGARAFEYGLVHRVYPAGSDLIEASRPFLTTLADLDPDAYRETKRAILAGLDLGFEASLR
ncbi:MAG: enoyl-CoA hydratase-related protein, partial [Gammaproteobacteria bacterium]|nr:enoyl-CoA hydratase-related protein [Gammaproteobacteria bacterium]